MLRQAIWRIMDCDSYRLVFRGHRTSFSGTGRRMWILRTQLGGMFTLTLKRIADRTSIIAKSPAVAST